MATLPSSSPMYFLPRNVAPTEWRRRHGGRPRGASSIADRGRSGAKPGQGLGRDLGDQGGGLGAGPGPAERSVRLTISRPGGGDSEQRRSAPPDDAQHGTAPAGQGQDATGNLPVERRRIEVALAGDHQIGGSDEARADRPARPPGRSRARGGHRGRPARPPSPRPLRPRAGVDVDAEVPPVAVGQGPRRSVNRAICSGVAPFWGPKTRAASRKGVVTSQATTSSIPASASGEPTAWHGAPTAVGGGRTAAAR